METRQGFHQVKRWERDLSSPWRDEGFSLRREGRPGPTGDGAVPFPGAKVTSLGTCLGCLAVWVRTQKESSCLSLHRPSVPWDAVFSQVDVESVGRAVLRGFVCISSHSWSTPRAGGMLSFWILLGLGSHGAGWRQLKNYLVKQAARSLGSQLQARL